MVLPYFIKYDSFLKQTTSVVEFVLKDYFIAFFITWKMQHKFKINNGQKQGIEIIKVMFLASKVTHSPFPY